MRETITITCLHCGKQKDCKASEVRRGQHKYCSRRCSANAVKVDHGEATCLTCGVTFIRRFGRERYCSRTCFAKAHSVWVKENQSGTNNPFYGKKHTEETREHLSIVKKELFANGTLVPFMKGKGDPSKYKRNHKISWNIITDKIKTRDGNRCIQCGSTERLMVHHIIPYRVCKSDEEDNLVCLCKKCHQPTYHKEYDFVEFFQGLLQQERMEINGV